ncbi:efflux transporter outer membrane subunit [Sphingomonas sp. DT-51]|uniref:efflux transporter outer membrane subunit n=1 Tax=Sphingomonas sp. DT-51 TaxID=3396165 RepID=UPI003F1DC7B0
MKKLALLPGFLLAGCVVGPDYRNPLPSGAPPQASGAFVELGRTTAVTGAPLPDRWWELYQDANLDRLVTDALAHNTDVRTAAANLALARAVLSEQKGARLPEATVGASGTYNRVAPGANVATAGAGAATGGRAFETDFYSFGFDASYEVDLFGGISRAIEAARGDTEAAAAQVDTVRVSVAAETARAYVLACGNASQRDVAVDSARLQRQTLDLTRTLFQRGRGTERDVDRADVLLAQVEATIPTFEAERRASLYALATLTGRTPGEIDEAAAGCARTPVLQQPLPSGDGAALLGRRPDVRAAERTLAANTARIGVATADLYPSIRLLGSLGFGGTTPGNAVKKSGFSFSLGPLISWNFPNQTVARARVRQARAGADASLARFDGVVLGALRETEQALARYSGALERTSVLTRAEDSSEKAARLSKLRFDYGAESFLLLIQAERDRADARAQLAQSQLAVANAQISLFKALGGGWQTAPEPSRRDLAAASAN